jgi:gyrA: DNA gyrase, A subunit
VQRLVRHRRRHGDQHSSAQHARGGRRRALGARPSGREPWGTARQPDPHHQGTGLPYRRHDSRP